MLFHCLKDSRCEPVTCADIARLSELHFQVVSRRPDLNLTQANQKVGSISEQVMIRHFEGSGWQQIRGQVGRTGIDGLLIKRNSVGIVREVLVAESKYNTSKLQSTSHGQQMSHDWALRKLAQLRAQQSEDATYRQVESLIQQGYYRARLWTMQVENGEIRSELQRIRSDADEVKLLDDPGTRVPVPPELIGISAPNDSFEKAIVAACMEELGKLGVPR